MRGIQEDGARTSVRPIESAGVVVYADGLVGFPIHQPGGLVAMEVEIFRYKGLQGIEVVSQPFGVAVHVADNEGGVLGQSRLVHVAFPRVAGFEHLFAAGGVAFDPDGNPAVHAAVTQ